MGWDTPDVGQDKNSLRAPVTARLVVVAVSVGVLLLVGLPAGALPVGHQFTPVQSPLIWSAASADGTAQASTVTIDVAEVARGDELPATAGLRPSQSYFYVALHSSYKFAGITVPIAMPPTPATLMTPTGTFTGLVAPENVGDDDAWYFPVPDTITTATLEVTPFSKVLGDERGDFSTWTFTPTTIAFTGSPPTPSTVPAPVQRSVGHRPGTSGSARTMNATERHSGTGESSLGAPLGVGVGALALLATGAAGLVSLRRRAFARADREGRVVLAGPPLIAGAPVLAGEVPVPERHGIVVKLLGPLELDGTRRPVTAGPLLELIVFLILNPGRSFTSIQLRESIWGLGRQPITSATFRNYMVELRKTFGPGVVVTERYRYELTEAVTSDWDRFQVALGADDALAGRDEALGLVRGPVLHGCFDGKKNSPFAWAVDTANDIEDQVTTVAVELAGFLLDLDDAARAATAVAQGLRCADTNLRLRLIDLRVGAALGGPREIGRSLQAGRAALASFRTDVAALEAEAGALGWVSAPPG